MSPDELRQRYLDFFAARGHVVIPSSSLVPENDPTTLFTGSGMQPLVPYLLGEEHPLGTRLVNSQKSFRSQDIEEVGDNRHTTFFEMLGNWSLGDYFKQEQLAWFFEFLTAEIGLSPERLFVSVYRGDEKLGVPADREAAEIWQQLFKKAGVKAELVDRPEKGINGRIFFYGNKNWWSRTGEPGGMPAGEPGGPDSEVFYDFGPELKMHESSAWKNQPCHPNCDCGRFLEIGNSVFMQYLKQADGSFAPLPKQNVDFGGGFERLLAAINQDPDVFQTKIFTPIIQELEKLSGQNYQTADGNVKRAIRVIADHSRAAVMLAADGVFPGNKEREYFARRLVRRAVRFGQALGFNQPFLSKLVPVVADLYSHAYPSVTQNQLLISQHLADEEIKFARALERGLAQLEKLDTIDEQVAFNLYQSWGFPFELTQEIAAEQGINLSADKFNQIKTAHQQQSRQASEGRFKGGLADTSERATQYHTATHLLHAALRQLFGKTIQQQGSHITGERLRFDFTFDRNFTDDELQAISQQINDWIKADLPVSKELLPKDQALAEGALAFFKEKYADQVSVYTIGEDPKDNWISKELCGGPHVEKTGQIPPLEIFKQKAVGSGVRRLYLRVK